MSRKFVKYWHWSFLLNALPVLAINLSVAESNKHTIKVHDEHSDIKQLFGNHTNNFPRWGAKPRQAAQRRVPRRPS